MKYIYEFLAALTVTVILAGTSNAQNPTYSLDVNNLWITSIPENCCDSMEFDIVLRWTNSGSVPNFEYMGGRYYFDFNKNCIKAGTSWTMSIAGSDLPENLRPRNPAVYTESTPGQLRLGVNTFPGAGNGFQIPAGTPVTVARVRIKAVGGDYFFQPELLQLAWRNGPDNPYTRVYAYVNSIGTEITTPLSHTISIPNDPMGAMIAAYFTASPTTIIQGQTTTFTDQTFGSIPVAWQWTFPGGTPATSSARNPVVTYNSPGVYNVALTASSPQYSNWTQRYSFIRVLPIPCIATWKHNIVLRDAGNRADSLTFGMSPSGNNGLDTCLGEILIPPPPPSGIFDCRFILQNNEAVKTDIRRDTTLSFNWRMTFQPSSSGYPITLNWNSVTLPSVGTFFLKDEITGNIVNVNMKNQSSFILTNPGITSLKIEYTYSLTMSTSASEGWNIVSVPLRTQDMLYTTLFPGVASQAYAYSGGYVSLSMLSNGVGYWMKFNSNSNFSFTGYPWLPENMPVTAGWNLIGPFKDNIPVSMISSSPPGIVISSFFGFAGGYLTVDTLKVGKGYWIRSTSAGYLYKSSMLDNPVASENISVDKFAELRFTSEDGNSANLYLADAAEIVSDYDLPPVPPQGVFDIRFGSDRFVEELGKSHSIRISSSSAPLKLSALRMKGAEIRIKDAVNGELLDKMLTEGSEIIIPQGLENLIIEVGNNKPLTYELAQNYPNPFNPSTRIVYQIPKDAIVKIVVYDVLGREVRQIVNGFKTAGTYEAKFESGDISSGVYFYRMTSGSFDEIRKMIVMK